MASTNRWATLAVLAFDRPEPMHEHVIEELDRAIEKTASNSFVAK